MLISLTLLNRYALWTQLDLKSFSPFFTCVWFLFCSLLYKFTNSRKALKTILKCLFYTKTQDGVEQLYKISQEHLIALAFSKHCLDEREENIPASCGTRYDLDLPRVGLVSVPRTSCDVLSTSLPTAFLGSHSWADRETCIFNGHFRNQFIGGTYHIRSM